jgi:hypothetical protein
LNRKVSEVASITMLMGLVLRTRSKVRNCLVHMRTEEGIQSSLF